MFIIGLKFAEKPLMTVGSRILRTIARILYTHHVSNAEVRGTTGCLPLSHLATNRHLWLFSHISLLIVEVTSQGSPLSLAAAIRPTSTAQLEATNRKT